MQNIECEYTEKQVSPWGGMRLMKELLDNSGIREELKKLPLLIRRIHTAIKRHI